MARFGDLDTQYFDDAGDPLVSGKVYFYESGTTTLKNTYADVNYTIANTNPVILTAAGRLPNVFFQGSAKAILTTSAGVQIQVRDPVGDTTNAFGNAWVASKSYSSNDVVQGSDGEYYVSLINGNVNNNPVSTSGSWTFLYSVEWSAGTTYKEGSVVTYESIVYQSLQNANLNQNPSTEAAYWIPIALSWITTQTYALNANVVGSDGILYTSIQAANAGNEPSASPLWWVGTSAAASASAIAAAASAAAALVSENAAAASETAAGLSETAAATSESNAATSESNASTSASNAATSESNASASAVSALGYLDAFKGQYYGSLASDPTVDPLGDPLTTGDLYWNSVSGEMKVYSGSAWEATYLPAAAYATLGANTFAGTQNLADNILQRANLLDYGEVTNAIGSTGGGTQDIDLTLGNSVTATVDTSTTTFTFSNPTATDEMCGFVLTLTNGGSQTVNWPASVKWAGGTAPTLTAAGVDSLVFYTVDGGTIWNGFISGADLS